MIFSDHQNIHFVQLMDLKETSLPLPIMLALLLTTVALASTGVLAKVRR